MRLPCLLFKTGRIRNALTSSHSVKSVLTRQSWRQTSCWKSLMRNRNSKKRSNRRREKGIKEQRYFSLQRRRMYHSRRWKRGSGRKRKARSSLKRWSLKRRKKMNSKKLPLKRGKGNKDSKSWMKRERTKRINWQLKSKPVDTSPSNSSNQSQLRSVRQRWWRNKSKSSSNTPRHNSLTWKPRSLSLTRLHRRDNKKRQQLKSWVKIN